MTALVREALDVAGEQFVDAAVVDEQAHERGRARVVVLGCGEEPIELVRGQADGRGVV